MKNWQIVLWLLVFFPVGLYLMFMHSDWKKPLKYGITGFFILILFLGGSELWSSLFLIGSFFAIIVGLFTVFRKKTRRNGLIILALGVLVFAVSVPMFNEQVAEREREEQLIIEAEAEAERLAEEERLEEIARKEEQRLKEEIVAAIEITEEYPTQANYNKALKLLKDLESKDSSLTARLDDVLPAVEAYEEKVVTAEKAVEQAQIDKNRATYDEAYELVSALPISNKILISRLKTLEEEITKVEEEERIATEAAQKQAEEEKRVAAEQEEQRQTEAAASRQSSGNTGGGSSSNSSSSSSGNTTQTPPPASSAAQPGQYVDENGNGLIKGSKNGIYHTPGSTYYSRTTNPVAWFKTIQEAKNAGYRAPKR